MTAVSYHDTVKDLQDLDWRADDPFTRLSWFQMLEDAGHKPLIALAQDGEDALALPLQNAGNRLEICTNWYAFTWHAIYTGDGPKPALLEAIARDIANYAKHIHFSKLPLDNGTLLHFKDAFRKAGWRVFEEPCDTNHFLRVDGRTYSEYFASLPGQLRSTIKRKAKLVDITVTDQFSADDWEAYEAIYAHSWKPEEGDPAMLRRFAEAQSAKGQLRFGIARHEGEPVAAQFWTVESDVAYIHKLAHLEASKKISAGTSLSAALFRHVVDKDKVREVDFGTGDDSYKRDWMNNVRERYSLTCLRPEFPGNWPLLVRLGMRNLVTQRRNG